jgi:hypothetical protein
MKAKCGNTAIAWTKSKCPHPAIRGLKLAVIFPNEMLVAFIVFYCALLVHPAWWHKYERVAPLVFIALMLRSTSLRAKTTAGILAVPTEFDVLLR